MEAPLPLPFFRHLAKRANGTAKLPLGAFQPEKEAMQNLTEIESQVTDEPTRQALLSVLRKRLAQLQQAAAAPDPASDATDPVDAINLTKEKIVKLSETAGSSLEPQHSPAGSDPVAAGSEPPQTGSDPIAAESVSTATAATETDPPATAKKFAAQLEQLDPELRQIALDLYEHLHHRSNFARLTADQRDAILDLMKVHPAEKLAQILAQPPPIGMNFETSKTGLNRFRDDFMRCAMRRTKVEAARVAEQQRLLLEEKFRQANASDETFRQTTEAQIRKRLFHAAHDANSDYHEIRWLIKSLEMLGDQST